MSKTSIKDDSNSVKFDHLSEFITAVANDNNETATKSITEYVNLKAKEIIQSIREDAKGKNHDEDEAEALKTRDVKKKPLPKMKKKTDESVVVEDAKGKSYSKDEDETDEDEDDEVETPVKLKTRATKKPPLKKMKKMEEAFLTEFSDEEGKIKLKGGDVFVEGKLVGTLKNDLDNDEAGITFESTDGKGGEFDNIKELYKHLMATYSKDAGSLE